MVYHMYVAEKSEERNGMATKSRTAIVTYKKARYYKDGTSDIIVQARLTPTSVKWTVVVDETGLKHAKTPNDYVCANTIPAYIQNLANELQGEAIVVQSAYKLKGASK